MSDSCKGNRLCQIRRMRDSNSIIDPLFVTGSSSIIDPLFKRNKTINDMNSYIEIKDPLTVRSPNQRRDDNYGEIIDPLFREYFTQDKTNCFAKWGIIMFFTFVLFLIITKKLKI